MLKSVGKFLRKGGVLNSLRAGFMGTQPVTVQGPSLSAAPILRSSIILNFEVPTFSFCSRPYKLCPEGNEIMFELAKKFI